MKVDKGKEVNYKSEKRGEFKEVNRNKIELAERN